MTVHMIHIGKTGGTSIKECIRRAKKAGHAQDVVLNRHGFTMSDLQTGDQCFFAVRDVVSRFESGFYSRLRKGQPRYDRPWRPREEVAFSRFTSARDLADALATRDDAAIHAMTSITHLRQPIKSFLGSPRRFRKRLDSVLFIARQETLSSDWERLRPILGIPDRIDLPTDPVRAHRRTAEVDEGLSDVGRKAILEWYEADIELLAICDEFRRERFGIAP